MKRFLIFSVSFIILISSFMILRRSSLFTPKSHAKLVYDAESSDQLIKDSELIIIGKPTNNKTEKQIGNVQFLLTKVKIEQVLKGDFKDSEITILQTKNLYEEPILSSKDRVLLCLYKYSGPVSDTAYSIKGAFQGHYKLENNKIKATLDSNKKLKDQMESLTLEGFSEKIEALKYK